MTDDRGRMSVFFCDNSTGEGKVTEAVYPSSVDRLPSSELAAACASLLPRKLEDGGRKTDDRSIRRLSPVLRPLTKG